MKVKQLRELLKDAPDDADVVVPAFDHSYRKADVYVGTALQTMDDYTEDHGEDLTPENVYGERVPVLIVS